MSISSLPDPVTLSGHFRVTCAAGAEGQTFIRQQAVSAPFHLGKPYALGDVMLVQAVNVTAGVFSGDRLSLDLGVESGARVLLTSPSAHRIHTMPSGHATFDQSYRVAAGGWLEVMPELFIPQAGSCYRQTTLIEVESGGGLFFCETLAPGRVARGESFAFDEVRWALDLKLGGVLVARERYSLRSGDASLWSLRHPRAGGYYAGCYLVAPASASLDDLRDQLHESAGPAGWIGMTELAAGCWAIKLLAPDSEALRESLRGLRARLAALFPALRADPRKL